VSGTNALIIKSIPLTSINEIQAIVLYNRDITIAVRVTGLFFELHNSINDPNLTEVLANTNVITSNVVRYRYNFPSISTYTGVFASDDSTTLIMSDSVALTEEANVLSFSTELTGEVWGGNLSVEGNLIAETLVVGSITSNGVNINTTLADILSRLEFLENS
jgi:hypothetical protein